MRRWVSARLPLTCGELLQGTLDGRPVLVSAPIVWYGTVTLEEGSRLRIGRGRSKMRQISKRLGIERVHVRAQHPVRTGAGYATSTADVAGLVAAWGVWCGTPFAPEEIARQAIAVEPSDSTMLPGLHLLAQQDGCWMEPLGSAPPLPLLLLDPGGTLDTVQWTRRLPRLSLDYSTRATLGDLRYALVTGDVAAFGAAASRSAAAYQPILPSPLVEQALQFAPLVKALGVVRAHSGPIVALLFDEEGLAHRATPVVQRAFAPCRIELTWLTDGGVQIVTEEVQGAATAQALPEVTG